MSPDLKDVINFMTMCLDELKLGYSALNTVRTSLSSFIMIDSHSIGSHPIISRFMKGVFQIKPAIPKNIVIWDTSIVLAYLKTLSPVRKLPIMELTKKAVTLSALLTGQRCQTLFHMDIRNIDINKSRICVTFGDLLKQSRPGCHLQQLTVKGYPPDRRLCLTTVLMEYMARVEDIRGHETRLFLTTKKPFKAASRPTVSRWVKQTLASAGVNMNIFTPHSTRSASTSTAMAANVPISTILKTAGWSRQCTFAKFYNKPISKQTFADGVLDHGCKASEDTEDTEDKSSEDDVYRMNK